jgi:NADPH-dependent ferric siderophore reductase
MFDQYIPSYDLSPDEHLAQEQARRESERAIAVGMGRAKAAQMSTDLVSHVRSPTPASTWTATCSAAAPRASSRPRLAATVPRP